MTTLRQIITDAYRESNLIPVGEVPEGEEYDEALRKLQNIIKTLIATELGENYVEVSYGLEGLNQADAISRDISSLISSGYLPTNTRIVCNLSADTTLYLDPEPHDGARISVVDSSNNFSTNSLTLDGNGRRIEEVDTISLTTDGVFRDWFYRADLGTWVRVTDLTGDDDSPFPSEFDDYLSISLALRLHPRHGVNTAAETGDALMRARRAFKARYQQQRQESSELALLRLPSMRIWAYGSNVNWFNKGLI
jgi:hypothetical protein